MIIKVPTHVLNENLTDRELVFSALMLFLSRSEGKKWSFNFFSEDVKTILGHFKENPGTMKRKDAVKEYALNGISDNIGNMAKLFKIGVKNYHTWNVSFPKDLPEDCMYGNGWIKESKVSISDQYAVKVYCYLVGRVSNGTIVSQSEPKLYDKDDRKTKALHPFFYGDFSLI